MHGGENESRTTTNQTPDRDDDGNTAVSIPNTPGINLESSNRDLMAPTATSGDGTMSRLRVHEQTSAVEGQQSKVQFIPTNNYFKNVSENKDVAKLVALLATCINATKKVGLRLSCDGSTALRFPLGDHQRPGDLLSVQYLMATRSR